MSNYEIWTAEIARIAEDFNRKMSVIMAVEWVAFGLSMVALAMLVVMETKWRKENGNHRKHIQN